VRAFLRRLTRDAAIADDLAQECFIKAYKKFDQLQSTEAARPWLFQIAYKNFLDHIRKTNRQTALAQTHIEDNPPSLASDGLSLDIERAMNSLSEDCRAVVMLCLAYGLTHEEAANITQQPLGTVKSHCKRGKDKLRSFLSTYETSR